MKNTSNDILRKEITNWLSEQKIDCDNIEELLKYITNILESCSIDCSVEEILDDNRLDIELTSDLLDVLGDRFDSEKCLGYLDKDTIIINFNNNEYLVYQALKRDETKMFVRVPFADGFKVTKENNRMLIDIKNLINVHTDDLLNWIEEVQHSKIKTTVEE